ncbi:MAG: ATP phosphoribosyltransferase regulatory subunit [Dehalococcoidia bacterium]|nr:ATP phosphoribosyltransferase regulatory subunit [Dehalococcoidia bacterium]
MDNKIIRPVPGFVDAQGADLAARGAIQSAIQRLFKRHGYDRIDTPILEHTDLFLRKSGGELASQMYTFTDQGGHQVSLRPEFTASVIRAFIQRAPSFNLPLRWQYAGPVFRYEPLERSRYRQFTQQGVELIGATGLEADAEVIALACAGIRELGLSNCSLDIGHIGVVLSLLDGLNLSERVKATLVSSLPELSQDAGSIAAVKDRLVSTGALKPASGESYLVSLIGCLPEQQAEAAIEGLLTGLRAETVGSRQASEIGARFLEKLKGSDKPEHVETAMNLVAKLSSVKGKPAPALKKARAIAAEQGIDAAPLEQLERLSDLLGKDTGMQVSINFGLARGLAYYTGTVFEIYRNRLPLCGGGRYDGLVRALGGEQDVAALGFAYNLEHLKEGLAEEGKTTKLTEGD